jgi:hypothetical protein
MSSTSGSVSSDPSSAGVRHLLLPLSSERDLLSSDVSSDGQRHFLRTELTWVVSARFASTTEVVLGYSRFNNLLCP